MSLFAEELIFSILEDSLLSNKIRGMITFGVKEIIQRIKDVEVVDKMMSQFIQLIDRTIEENSKAVMF